MVERAEESHTKVQELTSTREELEREILQQNNLIDSLQIEASNHEAKFANLQEEAHKYELMAHTKETELTQANEVISNYKSLNDDLCTKIEKLESVQSKI